MKGCVFMSNLALNNHNSAAINALPVYTVVIHKNEDGKGYWAKCQMSNGCCFTDGDTVKETQENIYESVSLYLEDDYPDITDYLLNFVIANE